MFFALNEYGSASLRRSYDALAIDPARKLRQTTHYLDVSEQTLIKWLNGKSNPPRAACYALWHECDIGRAVTSAHSAHGMHLWRTLAKSQADTITTLQARIDALCDELNSAKQATSRPIFAANEPFLKRY